MGSRGGGRRGGSQPGWRGEPRPFQGPGRGDSRGFQGGGFPGGGGPVTYSGGGRGDPRLFQQPGGPSPTRAPFPIGGGRGDPRPFQQTDRYPTFPPPATIRPPPVAVRPPVTMRPPPEVDPSPSQSVTSALEHLSISDTPASIQTVRFPIRPGLGSIGRKCLIRANHFLVAVNYNFEIWHYDVSIDPEVTSRAINRVLIRELVHQFFETHLDKKNPAYDGRKSLYTVGKLPFDSKNFKIKLPEREVSSTRRAEKEYSITIKFAGRPDLHHLEQFMRGRQIDSPQETIQALDVVLREKPSTNYTIVARSFFSTVFGHRSEIGAGMECWRGYYQSLRPTQMGLSLNIDISATSFYKSVPVVDFVAQHLDVKDVFRHTMNERDRIRVKKALKGIRVEVTHMQDLTRRYRVTGITPLPLRSLTFEDEIGNHVSVVQYFMDKYKCPLRVTHWPCLQAGSDSRPTYLPMEVCKIVEGQRYSKKLSDKQVTGILKATCKRPHEREKSIHEMVLKNDYGNDEFAKEFGMSITPNLATVEARVLNPPRLKYHETGRDKSCNPSVGQWNMIGKKMVNGGSVGTWTCINFSNLERQPVERFLNDLVYMCNNIGMKFNPVPILEVRQFRSENLEAVLRDVYRQSKDAFAREGGTGDKHLQLLLIILPEVTGSYGPIKRICETELGIVSQCCLPKHVYKSAKQYLENVSLKINVKVGGRNTVLEDALRPNGLPFVSDKATIIFGADVTHPAPGEDSQSSIAAVVASIDWPEITKYRGLVSAQLHRKEMISDLYTEHNDPAKGLVRGGMIREHMVAFYRNNKRKPERIIFYRDGVSEGQFNTVLLDEMDAIRKACASLEDGYLPPVTFIVVQKRHHTRLFPSNHGDRGSTDKSGNILPGTVVDTMICHPTEFDFYLCSHAGIQGTSRPTHYHVLYDENHFSADALQMLTNNLCYTYARCTRSVSVVPPAYYAHLAAFRARYYSDGDSDRGSSSAGGAERAGVARNRDQATVVRPLPRIKDNVKEVMFYC
uniref:Argonaute protein n=1 Tax=Lilium longiflorum TaxID=4690 RepID=W6JLH3_LILLO|nr:argonaute protein [Lilium longiflorum]